MIKGNAIVGQSGGPSAAINATLAGVIKGARESGAIGTIYGAFNGVEGMLKGTLCDLDVKVPDDKLTLLRHTPAAALGSCRLKLPENSEKEEDKAIYDKLFKLFEEKNIRYFFYIGGNDSMDTVGKLYRESEKRGFEMIVMGVPKTIDNDLGETDHTPGFGSAAKFVAATLREIRRDCAVYTKPAVTIVEIMGRDSGWLTASAGLADVDGIYLPEKPFDADKFLEDVKAALTKRPDVLIAISEGIRDKDGEYIGAAGHKGVDIFGHVNLSGAGKALELLVKEKLGTKVRSVELNVLQRCASHIASKTDLDEGFDVGYNAVKMAENGVSGHMATILRTGNAPYGHKIGSVSVFEVANLAKMVPDDYITESANGVTQACIDYIKPLIQGEAAVEYEDGLPKQLIISRD